MSLRGQQRSRRPEVQVVEAIQTVAALRGGWSKQLLRSRTRRTHSSYLGPRLFVARTCTWSRSGMKSTSTSPRRPSAIASREHSSNVDGGSFHRTFFRQPSTHGSRRSGWLASARRASRQMKPTKMVCGRRCPAEPSQPRIIQESYPRPEKPEAAPITSNHRGTSRSWNVFFCCHVVATTPRNSGSRRGTRRAHAERPVGLEPPETPRHRCKSASCHGCRRSAPGRFDSRWGRRSKLARTLIFLRRNRPSG